MHFNETVIELVKTLSLALGEKADSHITIEEETVTIEPALLTIDTHDMQLAGKINLQEKIPTSSSPNTVDINGFANFIQTIGNSIMRLNHVGVSYYVKDIQHEITLYKNALKGTSFKFYKEEAETPKQQWIFIGNTNNAHNPLMEIVLTEDTTLFQDWVPHFQIDIDTHLDIEELREYTETFFGKEFIQWELKDPKVGVILAMGILGVVDGIKIALGLGTNTRIWRLEELQQI